MAKILVIFAVMGVVVTGEVFDASVEIDTEGGKFGGPGYAWLEVEQQRRVEPTVKSFSVVQTSHGEMDKMGKIHRAVLTSVRGAGGSHHEHLEIKGEHSSEEDSREHVGPKGYFGGILAYPRAVMSSVSKGVHIPPPPLPPPPPVAAYKGYVGGYYPGSVGYGHSYRFEHYRKP